MLSASAQDAPALLNQDSICGFCETIGTDVKQSPDITTRILQALNFSKPPSALAKPELNERIGLCNKCEHQIKLLEEAANIRENLTESLLSNLKHLSTSTAAHPTLNGFPLNGQSPHHFQFAQSLQQRTNEITPQQHSIKRKISGITNWSTESQFRHRQLKRHIVDKSLEQTPNCIAIAEPTNSSDEENALMINELSSSVSPHSSHGSFTPPPVSPSTQQNTTCAQQVLSDVTCGRKRRKQARPAKAAGDIVPAVLPAVPQHYSYSIPSPTDTPSLLSTTVISPAPQCPISPAPRASSAHSSRPSSAATPVTPSTSPAPRVPAAKKQKPADAKASSAQLPGMASNPFSPALPFNYSSFYQNNISNLFSSQSAGSAAMLAQSIYKAASNNSLMTINNPLLLHKNFQLASLASQYSNKSHQAKLQPKSPGLLSAKKEPKLPSLSIHHLNPQVQPASQDGTGHDSSASTKVVHKLIKTDKRRYCKVCAASMRKANNGRPPQSRFLCEPCNMPMCRSCIEEHRYRVAVKGEEEKGDVKSSASAKLLQAVKMKDKAAGDGSLPTVAASKSLPSSILSTPPSHSSLIYGSPSADSNTHAVSPNMAVKMEQNMYSSFLPTQLASTPLDMRLPAYKPIAPAPAKPSIPDIPTFPEIKAEQMDEEDDDDKPLVIAESSDASDTVKQDLIDEQDVTPVADNTVEETANKSMEQTNDGTGDQTAITPEMANKTVAMLMPMEDDSGRSSAGVQNAAGCSPIISQSFQTIPQISTNGNTCAPVESSIPLQKYTPSVI